MEARRLEPPDEQGLKPLRRGWCLGSQDFKKEKLEQVEGKIGQHHFGALRLETAQAKAERIITKELGTLGWQEADLAARRKHDPGKVRLAARLRKKTTLTVKQIAERLQRGTPRSASVHLLREMKEATAIHPAQGRFEL